ncbi:sensor histidine kinase, partial [Paenarthrobacter sp. CM16]|nr:sensor histidine kinase [Paenarthrobacter sp. CM16]
MSTLSGVARKSGRSWLNPSTWHLRTRLVLVAMALLVAICGAVGVVSYASMDMVFNRQLDRQLEQASSRANDFGRPPSNFPSSPSGKPDPLEARGQAAGTLNARIDGSTVRSSGLIDAQGNRVALSPEDEQVLLALPKSGDP